MLYSHDSLYLFSLPLLWFLCTLGEGYKTSVSLQIHGTAFLGASRQILFRTIFSGCHWCLSDTTRVPHQSWSAAWAGSGAEPQELLRSWTQWSSWVSASSGYSLILWLWSNPQAWWVQQSEHRHADKGRGRHCPFSWQLAIGAIYWYYPNMSFSVLSEELWWLIRGWLQTPLPSNPGQCLSSDGRRAEDASFPNALTEDGSSRNQTWHLLHVVLGPRAVSCSSMEQTCLLLHCLVCGEQQTLGRGGDRHCYRFVIIKHQEPGVRARARSWGVLICTIPSMLPANFQCPLLPLPPAHKGWVVRSSVFIPRYR